MSFFGAPQGAPRAELAEENLPTLLNDAGITADYTVAREPDLDDAELGTFAFQVTWQGNAALVGMPGWPLHQVRFYSAPCQEILGWPRVLIDGEPAMWCNAAPALAAALGSTPPAPQTGAAGGTA